MATPWSTFSLALAPLNCIRSPELMADEKNLIPVERLERLIILIRGYKVTLDTDLAKLYGVGTKVLNQAVKRNQRRFPADFMFQLDEEEFENLRSQSVTSSRWGGRRTPPFVFTERGVAMLSSVLNSICAYI